MKKFLFILILILVFPICLFGCNSNSFFHYTTQNSDRFIVVEHFEVNDYYYTVLVDKDTKVMYLIFKCGYSGGITILLNEYGEPIIYDGEL